MLNQEKLSKLYTLATGKEQAVVETKKQMSRRSRQSLDKMKSERAKYKGIFVDPFDSWTKWYESIEKSMDMDNVDDAWKMAEEEFPGPADKAREWLRNRTNSQIESPDPAVKEIRARNTMSKTPAWLAEELLPDLAQTSNTVASQNISKAKAIYKKSLQDKIANLSLSDLDPNVPVDEHVKDAMLMETLGLLDTAQVMNGRLATVGQGGVMQPAFSLMNQQGIVGDGPENQIIQEVAEPVMYDYIESAISNTTGMMELDNKAASGAMLRMLKSGDLDISEWQNAIDVIGDADGAIEAGISGLVSKNPIVNPDEQLSLALEIGNLKRK